MLRHVFLKTDKEMVLAIMPFDVIINFKQLDISSDHPSSLIPRNDSHLASTGNDYKKTLPFNPCNADRVLIALTVKSYEFVIIETDQAGLLIKIAPESLLKLVKKVSICHLLKRPLLLNWVLIAQPAKHRSHLTVKKSTN